MSNVIGWREDRVGSAERGENPTVLNKMRTGWAVMGDVQHLPGYCLLLHADPRIDHLTDLPRGRRAEFLLDLSLLGEAVAAACSKLDPQFLRVNYEVLGNTLHQLHGHVHARYRWEPERYRKGPVWRYPNRTNSEHQLDGRHDLLRATLTAELTRVRNESYR